MQYDWWQRQWGWLPTMTMRRMTTTNKTDMTQVRHLDSNYERSDVCYVRMHVKHDSERGETNKKKQRKWGDIDLWNTSRVWEECDDDDEEEDYGWQRRLTMTINMWRMATTDDKDDYAMQQYMHKADDDYNRRWRQRRYDWWWWWVWLPMTMRRRTMTDGDKWQWRQIWGGWLQLMMTMMRITMKCNSICTRQMMTTTDDNVDNDTTDDDGEYNYRW